MLQGLEKSGSYASTFFMNSIAPGFCWKVCDQVGLLSNNSIITEKSMLNDYQKFFREFITAKIVKKVCLFQLD